MRLATKLVIGVGIVGALIIVENPELLDSQGYTSPSIAFNQNTSLICKAAMGSVFNHTLNEIYSESFGKKHKISWYKEGLRYTTMCWLKGDRVLWAWVKDNGSIGNTRENTYLQWHYEGSNIVIAERYPDGSSSIKKFKK